MSFLGSLVKGYRDLRWHEYYSSLRGRPSPYFVPDDIFYSLLLLQMNPPERAVILSDKNNFDLMDRWPRLPQTLGRLVNGRLLDEGYATLEPEALMDRAKQWNQVIIKPTRQTGSGKGLQLVPPSALLSVLPTYRDAIVQVPVEQHADLAVLNAASVNTVRAITYRKLGGEIVYLFSALRCGRQNSLVDNTGSGGFICRVQEDGTLDEHAYNKHYARLKAHPDSRVPFARCAVPHYDALRHALIEAHLHTPWIDYATWDATIDSAGQVVLIEVNVGTTLSGPQVLAGPIFEHLADDIGARIGRARYSALFGFL